MTSASVPRLSITAMLFLLFSTSSAFAYIDPGTGSLMLQAIIGSLAVGLLAVRRFWARIVKLFTHQQSVAPDDEHKD